MDDDFFLSQLKAGNDNAYDELVKEFGNKIFNTCMGMLQNTEDAEDVTQEVFIQIFRSINQFKGESKLSTWIYRIAITKSLDFLRKKKRKKNGGLLSALFKDESLTPIKDVTSFYHPGMQLENKERGAILFAAIHQLPENQKTAFILHKVESVSYNEIASIMNLSLSSVESLLFRAKQNLQKLLGDYYKPKSRIRDA